MEFVSKDKTCSLQWPRRDMIGCEFEIDHVMYIFTFCVYKKYYDHAVEIFNCNDIDIDDIIQFTEDLCYEYDIDGVEFLYKLIKDMYQETIRSVALVKHFF